MRKIIIISLGIMINQAFSADRALEVAKLTKTYDRISTKRALTKKEKNTFL